MLCVFGTALAAMLPAVLLISTSPVAADQVSQLRQEALHLSQELTRAQLQYGVFEQQYGQATGVVERDAANIATLRQAIEADQQRVQLDRRQLRSTVIDAYINLVPISSEAYSPLFDSNVSQSDARSEYEQLAVGDVQTRMAILRNSESALQRQQSALRVEESRDAAAQREALSYLHQAEATQSQIAEQSQLVNGQLAVAVAAAQAAQAAAAQAAIQQAKAAAATRAAAAAHAPSSTVGTEGSGTSQNSTTSTSAAAPVTATASGSAPAGPAAGSGGGATSDPALNPFLQCALQAESGGNYSAVSPNGVYMGGFQFSQATWNGAAQLAGLPGLIGVPPNLASKADQDTLAVALYAADGQAPWDDSCRN
jgi:Transglycosylase-like domain